ncbi:MAG: hypothetical protein JNJ60_03545 [Rhodocyclaceae bacterium]|nr:hypothetical protein [Rhodocyclaceae bacterium]
MSDTGMPRPSFPVPAKLGEFRHGLPSEAALRWLAAGWRMYLQEPLLWVVATFIFLLAWWLVSLVPLAGPIALNLFMPVLAAGWLTACRRVDEGGPLKLVQLTEGFRHALSGLVLLGVAAIASGLVILLLATPILGLGVWTGMMSRGAAGAGAAAGSFLVGLVVLLVLAAPVLMALWFAPALVMLQGRGPLAALLLSLRAWLANPAPLGLFLVMLIALWIFATLPAGLGLLVFIPVAAGAHYASFRELFHPA